MSDRSALALLSDAGRLGGRLPPLLIEADRVAATVAQGVHGRRRVGQGEAFWQYRDYQPGDPAGAIDWRQTAKRERAYVRQTEWEAAQSLFLWCDASPSMAWRGGADRPTKQHRAAVLSLALAELVMRAGEQVALIGEGEPPRRGRSTLERLAMRLGDSLAAAHAAADRAMRRSGGSETAALRSLPDPAALRLPGDAHAIVFSDFLDDPQAVLDLIGHLSSRRIRGILVQVLDPDEEALPYAGRVRFSSLEGEDSTTLSKVQAVRGKYAERLAALRHRLTLAAEASRWRLLHHTTSQPAETALLALFNAIGPTLRGGR